MTTRAEAAKEHLVDRIVHLAHERSPAPELAPGAVERFIRQLWQGAPPDDLARQEADTLYGATMSLLALLRHRRPGEGKIRISSPRMEQDGWHCDHTVIDVVQDDMPFLVDTITGALSGADAEAVTLLHPVLSTVRSAEGQLLDILEPQDDGQAESLVHLEITEISDPARLARLQSDLEAALADNRAAVEDWMAVRTLVSEIQMLLSAPLVTTDDETRTGGAAGATGADNDIAAEFLVWLLDNHFTFLGYRHHHFACADGQPGTMAVSVEKGLGILRDPDTVVFHELRNLSGLPADVVAFLNQPSCILITKANRRSRVHRAVHMDVVGIKEFSADGTVSGLHMLVGLFTSNVYTNSASFVPVLRRKVDRVLKRTGMRSNSHDGKRLLSILENLPRDELFQASEDKLLEMSMRILHLQERQRTALLVRQDAFERFASCLVFVPRDRYDTALRLTVKGILEEAFHGTLSTYYTQVADSPLARLHFIIKTHPGQVPAFDVAVIEDRITLAARAWPDHLMAALVSAHGEEQGVRLARRYGEAFPASYRERVSALAAVHDIGHLEQAAAAASAGGDGLAMSLYRPLEAAEGVVNFKLYHPQRAIPLSDVLPMLENMGFRVIGEEPFEIRPRPEGRSIHLASAHPEPAGQVPAGHSPSTDKEPGRVLWMHDFSMMVAQPRDGEDITPSLDVARIRDAFHQGFARVWSGEAENDGFNRLIVLAGLDWREVVILRAYARYLRQAAFTFSQASIETALAAYPQIARALVGLFHARLDPAKTSAGEDEAEERIRQTLLEALDKVSSPDDDRILRRFLNLVDSTLRTSFYQKDAAGLAKSWLAFKLDSQQVEELPLPRPMVEIWVYSPRTEAIHLRGGKVARGGIRWSDRREDFRTEILGLIKAQMVKNAVIVPVGSKGGFVVKRPPATGGREALQAEGIACYRILMQGLLDLTDSITVQDGCSLIVPPPDVRRRDGDDPYLVVAADKGTATFSDIANGISADYGFWLGDAFASGGSQGYDHKVMGITARGAWEAVKRHFRELEQPGGGCGLDIQSQDFTVVGVGDMSGDVFGNGMLLSRHIRLVAAFNHQHIFLDPDPDPESSWQERRRLFDLPRSTWADYDPALISAGGGVFERRARKIPLSPAVQALLGTSAGEMAPNDLIRLLLTAPVDLLWFGGIGTYIRATSENDVQVGDRANDAVRVCGRDIRAKVVGEGANLGVTQRGRIEYALQGCGGHGGRINTDAIDNSAGVDCSDHEVNIKILLNAVVMDGDMTVKQRNQLLASMTSDVAAHVLRDNYLQTQAISMIHRQGVGRLDHQARLIRLLEKSGRLNRAVEFLPDDDQIAERLKARVALTRPEIAVVIAYAKMWLFDEILASDLPDEPLLRHDLVNYFPPALQETFASAIDSHRLRREIIATHAANSMINRVGGAFVTQIMEKTGMPPAAIARACLVVRDAFALREVWTGIEALDAKVPAAVQYDMLAEANRLLERGTLWVLRHAGHRFDMARLTADLASGVRALEGNLSALCSPEVARDIALRSEGCCNAGVPPALADRVSEMIALASVPDVVRLGQELDIPFPDAARYYFAVGDRFALGWLRSAAESFGQGGSHWDKLAVAAVIDELYADQREITASVLRMAVAGGVPLENVAATLADWTAQAGPAVARADQLMSELRAGTMVDLAMVTVASRQIGMVKGQPAARG